jgi:predicted membrane protein
MKSNIAVVFKVTLLIALIFAGEAVQIANTRKHHAQRKIQIKKMKRSTRSQYRSQFASNMHKFNSMSSAKVTLIKEVIGSMFTKADFAV